MESGLEKPSVQATVVFLQTPEGEFILARKKQPIHHDDGEISYSLGLYNGYGGKREPYDRDIFETAIRELQDESGVKAQKENLQAICRGYFYIQKENQLTPFMDVWFFIVSTFEGLPVEGVEMGPPQAFLPQGLPYEEMMPADKILVEKMCLGEPFVADVILRGKDITPEVRFLDETIPQIL